MPSCADAGASRNHRNGSTGKTVLTENGPLRIEVPRDREGSFEPLLIPKHERRFTGFDDKIVAMYARGMTVREIQGFLAEQYGTEVSPEFISSVTDAAMAEVTAWQSRPLEPMYPVVFFDALRVKIREDVVLVPEDVELALLPLRAVRRRLGHRVLQRLVHPLVPAVLLWLARLDELGKDSQLDPPHRQLAQPAQRRRSERHPVVAADPAGQAVLLEDPGQHRLGRLQQRARQPLAAQQVAAVVVRHRQRVAVLPVAQPELALVVHAPAVVGPSHEHAGSPRVSHRPAPGLGLDEPSPLEHVAHGGLRRHLPQGMGKPEPVRNFVCEA